MAEEDPSVLPGDALPRPSSSPSTSRNNSRALLPMLPRAQLADLEAAAKKGHGSGLVKLNIGGVRYTTTIQTLLCRGENFFSGLLSRRFAADLDEEGAYFIDRNGHLFEPLLDFLRTGDTTVPYSFDKGRVAAEAKFFLIEGMMMESDRASGRATLRLPPSGGASTSAPTAPDKGEVSEEADQEALLKLTAKDLFQQAVGSAGETVLLQRALVTCLRLAHEAANRSGEEAAVSLILAVPVNSKYPQNSSYNPVSPQLPVPVPAPDAVVDVLAGGTAVQQALLLELRSRGFFATTIGCPVTNKNDYWRRVPGLVLFWGDPADEPHCPIPAWPVHKLPPKT